MYLLDFGDYFFLFQLAINRVEEHEIKTIQLNNTRLGFIFFV